MKKHNHEHDKQYLGDSVYVEVENVILMLTTENGTGIPGAVILLEVETMENLIHYYKRAKGSAK